MAIKYGKTVTPYEETSDKMEEMCEHTGWSKAQLILHMVSQCYGSVMAMPGAPKPGQS